MPSFQSRLIKPLLRAGIRNSYKSLEQLQAQRSRSEKGDRMLTRLDRNFSRREETLGSLSGQWITTPRSDPDIVLLYFHGGGLCLRTPAVHGQLLARICEESGVTGLMPDYRLAPEDPFPAAYQDALEAYSWLLERGFPPAKIVIGGDSAGGTLTIGTLLSARDAGLPMPAGALLISPAIAAMHQPAIVAGEKEGAVLSYQSMLTFAEAIGADKHPEHHLASLVEIDYAGLPPMLFQVGGDEILLPESINGAARAEAAGVDVELEVYEGLMHVFQIFGWLPEAKCAISQAAKFIREHLE